MASEYRNNAILLGATNEDPQAVGHMRAGCADQDGLAAPKYEANERSHFAPPGQLLFAEGGYELATFAVERFGRLGKEGSDLIYHMAASVVLGQERRPQMMVFPSNIDDHPRRDPAPSLPVQSDTE